MLFLLNGLHGTGGCFFPVLGGDRVNSESLGSGHQCFCQCNTGFRECLSPSDNPFYSLLDPDTDPKSFLLESLVSGPQYSCQCVTGFGKCLSPFDDPFYGLLDPDSVFLLGPFLQAWVISCCPCSCPLGVLGVGVPSLVNCL